MFKIIILAAILIFVTTLGVEFSKENEIIKPSTSKQISQTKKIKSYNIADVAYTSEGFLEAVHNSLYN